MLLHDTVTILELPKWRIWNLEYYFLFILL